MKPRYLFIFLFLTFVLDATAQTDSSFRKIDVSVGLSDLVHSNLNSTTQNGVRSTFGTLTFYPLQYKKTQFGITIGFERVVLKVTDSTTLTENRIPLLLTTKWNIYGDQAFYIKMQLGTALTTKSLVSKEGDTEYNNLRSDIGAPILANMGMGVNLPFNKIGVGVEFGYAYKQISYKSFSEYNPGAVYLSLVVSLP